MPINLDFVGLNTLVREEIDTTTNTIGEIKTKALSFPDQTDFVGLKGENFTSYPSNGPLSISFWAKVDPSYEESDNLYVFSARNGSGTGESIRIYFNAETLHFQVWDDSGTQKKHQWFYFTVNSQILLNWNHYTISWDGEFSGQSALFYLNGEEVVSIVPYSDPTPSSGNKREGVSIFTIGSLIGSSNTFNGLISHFAFIGKQLSTAEVGEIYSNGFVNDLRNTSFSSDVFAYWTLGDEPELEGFSTGDEITSQLSISSTIGNQLVVVNSSIFMSEGLAKETRNRRIATVPYNNYLVALNTHRNGPYGHSTFKQLRVSENPITKYHNRNNILTTVDSAGLERTVIKDGEIISIHRDRYGQLKSFDESVVVSNKKPISSIVNIKMDLEDETIEEKLVISAPFTNETSYFKNEELNAIMNAKADTSDSYEEFKKIYKVTNSDSPIVRELESIKFEQTIFPTNLYSNKSYTRLRPSYSSDFWRTERSLRTKKDVDNLFGHIIPSQSMWPLDAEQDFQSLSLLGDPGVFRIYGPATLTASTTPALPSSFLSHPKATTFYKGILFYDRASAIETADVGYTTSDFDWVESQLSSNFIILRTGGASYGDHLVKASQVFWSTIADTLLDPIYGGYSSVNVVENLHSRKGIYLSDLGNIDSRGSYSRYIELKNIRDNTAKPTDATKNETYRQHWASCSVDCGITFWNALSNNPIDSYDTLFYDVSASNDLLTEVGSLDVGALNRQIYYSTSSVKLPDNGFTSYGSPRLVVRLGTKWFKNDGTVYYGNTPENGAVEYIFDNIWGVNNGFSVNDGGYHLKPHLSRQSHFYVSLSQSNMTIFHSGNVQLAINGEFMSASFVNDQWGFFNGNGHVPPNHLEYTASTWTSADTGSTTTDAFFFQAGNKPDDSYCNEMYFSDIAIFSGTFAHNSLAPSAMNDKVKFLCGGVTATETKTNNNTGVRFQHYGYAKTLGSLTELSGPFVWYDFEKTDTGAEFDTSFTTFGLSTASATPNVSYYNYYAVGPDDIDGYVQPITELMRLDSGSYGDFTAVPGTNYNTYLIGTVHASGSSMALPPLEAQKAGESKIFTSPDDVSTPIGGSTGRNSFSGPGILQNSYSQFTRVLDLSTAVSIDTRLSASAFYARRHSLTQATSVKNPFFTTLSSSTIYPLVEEHLYLGSAFWDAPTQAGYYDTNGEFVSEPKEPFYDSYGKFAEEFRGLGKEYSIVPEFIMSNHVNKYLSNGPLEENLKMFEVNGAMSNLDDSSEGNFYKVYSNTEFLNLFDVVKQDHKKFFDPYKITLQCKAIKKFLPYKGFYPCEKTTDIAQQFYSSYTDNITATSSQGVVVEGQNYPSQYLLNPLFGPGVLFNTIKSGIACDYPIVNSSLVAKTPDDTNYYIDQPFDTRIPFEALIEPEKYLANVPLFSNEPDPRGNAKTEIVWNGQGDELYKLKMNNFLSEVGNFFLVNENYTTLSSLPEGDPNFGNAESGKVYSMRLKMYRSISGSKSGEASHDGIKFSIPQDSGSMGEAFTMYSRPSAFGPPTMFSASSFQTENWNSFKREGSTDFAYATASTYTHVTASKAEDGYNFPFTPPYYHGEAWADIIFVPPSGTKKYSLSEVINNSSVEFFRFFESGSHPQSQMYSSGTVVNNDQAMQIASSMNIFSKGILRQDLDNQTLVETEISNKYRWIIQSKFETPTLNFNHHSHDTITMPNVATSSVPIGMWHQYGRIPQSSNEGIFVQIEDIPRTWVEGAMRSDYNKTGSLLNLCGFSADPVRIGDIKQTKIIQEAVVAVPFIRKDSKNTFFNLKEEDVKNSINGNKGVVGKTINKLVEQVQNYVFPPSFDFVNFPDVKPLAMYVFEFSHTLTKKDLANIWQNLPPDIGTTHEQAISEVSHELFSQEFLGSGATVNQNGKLEKFTNLSNLPSDIRWMVFKVKKRASNNYFEKMFERNDSGTATESSNIAASTTGKKQKIGYNWPYDFFSMVELIKLDASVEFGKIDKEKSIQLDQTFLEPVLIKDEE